MLVLWRFLSAGARDPLPWIVFVLFCDCWLSQEVPLLAAAALLQFDTYLRPGSRKVMFCLQCATPASSIVVGGLLFARLPSSALRSLALKMTPCSSATLVGFGLWVFCGHYIIGVPHPRTLFSVAYSCSDMNKGSTMPALLWVFSGFMQCLTRSATPYEVDRTRNVAAGDHQSPWSGTKKVPSCFASSLSSLTDFFHDPPSQASDAMRGHGIAS